MQCNSGHQCVHPIHIENVMEHTRIPRRPCETAPTNCPSGSEWMFTFRRDQHMERQWCRERGFYIFLSYLQGSHLCHSIQLSTYSWFEFVNFQPVRSLLRRGGWLRGGRWLQRNPALWIQQLWRQRPNWGEWFILTDCRLMVTLKRCFGCILPTLQQKLSIYM